MYKKNKNLAMFIDRQYEMHTCIYQINNSSTDQCIIIIILITIVFEHVLTIKLKSSLRDLKF